MFADPENIEAYLVGQFDFFQKMLHALDRAERESADRIRDGCGEAVDADLHYPGS
jgi:hypothetical protein